MKHSDLEFNDWKAEAANVSLLDTAIAGGATLKRMAGEWVGSCPMCGGKDRFAINTRKNIFNCRGCDAKGDVISLAQKMNGFDFLRACEFLTGRTLKSMAGETDIQRSARLKNLAARAEVVAATKAKREVEHMSWVEKERRWCIATYHKALPAHGTIVEKYLNLRGIELPKHTGLRFIDNFAYYGDPVDGEHGKHAVQLFTAPAMVCPFLRDDSSIGGLHITWLDLSQKKGKKLYVCPKTGETLPAKKMRGQATGVFMPLNHGVPAEPRLVSEFKIERLLIGEGIETSLSVFTANPQKYDVVWAAGSLNNLTGKALDRLPHPTEVTVMKNGGSRKKMVVGIEPDLSSKIIPIPEIVRELTLLQDGDSEEFFTKCAMQRAFMRFSNGVRGVRVMRPPAKTDFNDLRMGFNDATH